MLVTERRWNPQVAARALSLLEPALQDMPLQDMLCAFVVAGCQLPASPQSCPLSVGFRIPLTQLSAFNCRPLQRGDKPDL